MRIAERSAIRALAQFSLAGERMGAAQHPVDRARRKLRQSLLRVTDPAVRYALGSDVIELPLSHALPGYRRAYPRYDQPFCEAVASLAEDEGPVRLIDVGANVGDTAVLALQSGAIAVLCVEGHPDFVPYLRRNAERAAGRIAVADSLVGETAGRLKIRARAGTATADQTGCSVQTATFEQILSRHEDFRSANLLKIDTDGHDLAVLRSAAHWLASRKPALFFEFDPRLWGNQGFDSGEVWPLLGSLGYSALTLWSNVGDRCWRTTVADARNTASEALEAAEYVDVLASRPPRDAQT